MKIIINIYIFLRKHWPCILGLWLLTSPGPSGLLTALSSKTDGVEVHQSLWNWQLTHCWKVHSDFRVHTDWYSAEQLITNCSSSERSNISEDTKTNSETDITVVANLASNLSTLLTSSLWTVVQCWLRSQEDNCNFLWLDTNNIILTHNNRG